MYSINTITILMYSMNTIILLMSKKNMSPLADRYKEKAKLREVKCLGCGSMMATRMKIPRCGKCGVYTEE